jgi:hypothetical protein
VAFLASKIYFTVKKVLRSGRKISRSQTRKSGTVMNKIVEPGKKSATRIGSAKASFVPFSPSKHSPLSNNRYGCKQQSLPHKRELHHCRTTNPEIVFTNGNLNETRRYKGHPDSNFEINTESNPGRPAGGGGVEKI